MIEPIRLAATQPSPPAGVSVRRSGHTAVVAVSGALGEPAAGHLADVLWDLLDNEGVDAVVVDCSDVSDLCPSAPNRLLIASGWARLAGVDFRLRNPPPTLREALGGVHLAAADGS